LAVIVTQDQGEVAELLSELRQFLAQRVAKFWVPEYWCVRESIPKTSVGKIDKKGLRAALASNELTVQRHDSERKSR
jgi:fatty-acyl-CoA synthase